jgi:FkbM family methyltransferase
MTIFFHIIPKLIIIFSGNHFNNKIELFFKLYFFFLCKKVIFIDRISVKIPVTFEHCQTHITLRHYLDFAVLTEVFIHKEYAWFPTQNPVWILDLGAHIGDTAIFYAGHFPDATVVAVEADPDNFHRLQENTKGIPNIKVLHAAIGDVAAKVQFYTGNSSLAKSTLRRDALSFVYVNQVTIGTVMKQYGISKFDILKFDIEGAETCLLHEPNLSKLANHLIGEIHLDLTPSVTLDSYRDCFKQGTLEFQELKKAGRFVMKVSFST